MSYKPTDEKTAGIDLDGTHLNLAFLVLEKGKIRLKQWFQDFLIPLDEEGSHVNPLYMVREKEAWRSSLNQFLLVSGLSASDTLVRRLRLKLTREKDIDETFAFQAEPLLPFPLDNGIIDKMITEKQEGSTLLTLLAVRKDYIKKHFDLLEKLEIDPEVISGVPVALTAFVDYFASSENPVFAIHIGYQSSSCTLVKEGKLLASHGAEVGIKTLEDALSLDSSKTSKLSDLDLSKISAQTHPHLNKAMERLIQEISWKVMAEAKETKLKENSHLLFTGEGSKYAFICKKIEAATGYKELLLETKEGFDIDLTTLKALAVAIGLSLTVQPQINLGIDFRQGEFSYQKPWKRFQNPLLIYGGLALLLALAFYLFDRSYLAYGQDKLKERYLSMLAMIQKPYAEFERSYETKHPLEHKGKGDAVLSIQELNQDDLQRRLDFLEKEIRSMPDTFPLHPNVPRVSDVLAWLSTHPKVTCKDSETEEEDCAPLKIESFNYTLVKRPEQNKKNEKYQVKVDLEFSTSSPRIAREFHDALIAPNDLIDPKGEVKWSSNRGKYRTTFFLKDRTQYPSPLKG